MIIRLIKIEVKMEKVEDISERGELLILNPQLINQLSIAPVVLYIRLILLKFEKFWQFESITTVLTMSFAFMTLVRIDCPSAL